ncbi:hypothetical protein [Nocardioides sp. YIM 152588]|uniref:hypothetical protein n=1 Tax=Nocardioides sp. YIM 152588 TaxID=3158259 RepID=UPI0032E3B2AE
MTDSIEHDPVDEAGEDERVRRFWTVASERAKLATMPGYFGPSPLASVPPPTWSFGEDPAESDRLLGVLLAGERDATAVPAAEYGEAPPVVGTLGIVLDGSGRPRALVSTRSVEVMAPHQVDVAGLIDAEAFPGAVGPDGQVVVERLKVLYEE